MLRQLEWARGSNIEVSAREGVVTLSGSVPGYSLKIAAEEAAKSVDQVIAFVNDIRVATKAYGEHYAAGI